METFVNLILTYLTKMLQEQMNSTNDQNVTLDLVAKYIKSPDFQQGFKAWLDIEQSYGFVLGDPNTKRDELPKPTHDDQTHKKKKKIKA